MSKFKIIIDTIEPNLNTISMKIEGWYIDDQGEIQIRRERRAFNSEEIAEVNDWLEKFAPNTDKSGTISVLNALWSK